MIVSIPAQIRHLYGNTQRDKRISTGTTDRGIAERQLHDLSKRIYDELDLKQSQYLARHNVATDTFAIDAIYGLAAAFNLLCRSTSQHPYKRHTEVKLPALT